MKACFDDRGGILKLHEKGTRPNPSTPGHGQIIVCSLTLLTCTQGQQFATSWRRTDNSSTKTCRLSVQNPACAFLKRYPAHQCLTIPLFSEFRWKRIGNTLVAEISAFGSLCRNLTRIDLSGVCMSWSCPAPLLFLAASYLAFDQRITWGTRGARQYQLHLAVIVLCTS